MCELCTAPRPPAPSRPDPSADPADLADLADLQRPQGVWTHLSGVRGHLALHPLGERSAGGEGDPSAGDDGALRLVVSGDLTRRVLQWSDDLAPDVLARVRVVCTTRLTHLDDAGRALLVDLVRLAHRRGRRLHVPAPSPAATSVLARFGLLGAVDRGPDPWAGPAVGGPDGGGGDGTAQRSR